MLRSQKSPLSAQVYPWVSILLENLLLTNVSNVPPIRSANILLNILHDDLNSFDSINAMHKRLHGYHVPDIDPQTLTYEEKKALLDGSPITAARHLNFRVRQVYKLMKKHSEQLFGYKLKDYTYRIEFQNRGSGM